MRLSWYAGTGVAVFSIWHGDTCTGTFRLPIPELARMIEVLSEGPPEAVDDPRAADPGAPTIAAGPGGMPAAVAGLPGDGYGPSPRDRDLPPGRYQHPPEGYSGYGDAPAGYPGEPARAGTVEERGYQEWAPDGYQDAPGGYEESAPGGGYRHASYQEAPYQEAPYQEAPGGGYNGLPPGGGYQDAPGGGYRDAPGSGYEEFAPESGYQDAPYQEAPYQGGPGGGYRDAGHEGYRDLPPEDAYGLPDSGYRDAPAGPGYGGPGQFAGSDETSYPPSGPLGVGRWRTREPEGDYHPGQPAGEFAPGQDETAFAADPLDVDPLDVDYGGEAEQGYLPGPPTDTFTFPAAAAGGGSHRGAGYSEGPAGGYRGGQHSGGYRGEGSDEDDGYEPDPADLDHDAGPPESFGYGRGPGGSREREYGHSRGRS
jgi:hypothetical protein